MQVESDVYFDTVSLIRVESIGSSQAVNNIIVQRRSSVGRIISPTRLRGAVEVVNDAPFDRSHILSLFGEPTDDTKTSVNKNCRAKSVSNL